MTLTILSLEDEADVREALERDLENYLDRFRLEMAEDVDDAWAVIKEIEADGDELALVLSDHRLPGRSGVDFLVELVADERLSAVRTVLVTGQANQEDTIRAVNEAGLDYYIAKPWDPEALKAVVRNQLTEYVLETGTDPLPYMPLLDGVRVMEAIRSGM
ncbi:response regulator [Schaalia sp. ZJ405]|uniref:response regulator n=1 Tax=unclassified Schaalia TaxID=2691889 RepID=UPI0013EE1F54|nr:MULTISPECIES: response regulator [unclassified Schaalia]QPK81354.1 response regulator [Schaalia sp. ZJ405]